MYEICFDVLLHPRLFCFVINALTHANTVKFRKYDWGLYFSKTLFEGLIFGGAYIRRGLSTEGNLRLKIDWTSLIVGSKFTIFALFYFVFEGSFQEQAPGGLYWEGRFNGGFFALRVWGAYIWRGLYMEGLIFGILRYATNETHAFCAMDLDLVERSVFRSIKTKTGRIKSLFFQVRKFLSHFPAKCKSLRIKQIY